MKKRFFALLMVLSALLCLSLPAHAVELPVKAKAALLMEKETGQVLFAQNEHEKLEPASVTKIMTLLLVMEAMDRGELKYEDMVTVSANAASMGGSQVYLSEGEQISVEELLKAVCVSSGNDAAVALAEQVAGVTELFVQQMNNRAMELGMGDTHFVNPTGLPAEGHVTQALGTGDNHIPGAAGSELLVLELFLNALELHVLHTLAGTHEGGCPDEPRELVGGKEHLFHFVGGLHIAADAVAMAAHSVDEFLAAAGLLQKLRGLDTVLLRPLLKVDVVEQTHGGPEVRILPVAQLVGIPAHDALYGQAVLDVKRLLVIFFQCGESRIPADTLFHKGRPPYIDFALL